MKVQDDITVVLGTGIDDLVHQAAITDGIKEPPVLVQGKADDVAMPIGDGIGGRGRYSPGCVVVDSILQPIDIDPGQTHRATTAGVRDGISLDFKLRRGGLDQLGQ